MTNALRKVSAPFALEIKVYGSADECQWCDLHGWPQESRRMMVRGVQVRDIMHPRQEEVDALLAVLQRSPFGRGEETVTDPDVRDAWEAPASDVKLPGLPTGELFRLACDLLGPRAHKQNTELVLHKLCLYQQGGHFAPHVDAMHRPGHVATLVFQLPFMHTGGELLVAPPGSMETAPLSPSRAEYCSGSSTKSDYYASGRAVAFFTDCVHEVRPVTSGVRLVLQFDIVHAGGVAPMHVELAGMHSSRPWSPKDGRTAALRRGTLRGCLEPRHEAGIAAVGAELMAAIRAIMPSSEAAGGHVALLLRHRYTTSALKPDLLRGSDATLWAALCHAAPGGCADLHLTPIVLGHEVDIEWDTEWTCATSFPFGEPAEPEWLTASPKCVLCTDGRASLLQLMAQEAVYFGNESITRAEWYYGAALVVRGNDGPAAE